MKKIIVLSALLLLVCGCGTKMQEGEIKQITCDEKESILENDKAMLIDVREEEEYKENHLEKAINIPYEKIVETLDTYGTIDLNVPIIVYCKSGTRSSIAAESLKNAGYKHIYNLGAMSNCDK